MKVLPILALLISARCSFAVNLYDGAKPPDGLYFLSNLSHYKSAENRNVTETLRLTYYDSLFVGTVLLPVGGLSVKNPDNTNTTATGVGNLTLGVGSFLPINKDNQYNKKFNILPMIFVQFPTRSGFGGNQFGISPQIYFHKITDTDTYALDVAAKYSYKFRDRDSKVKLGSELSLESVIGFNINDRMKLGPAVNWMRREKTQIGGAVIPNTDDSIVSGGLNFLVAVSSVNMEFTYMRDVYTKRTEKGNFFQFRMMFNIWDK